MNRFTQPNAWTPMPGKLSPLPKLQPGETLVVLEGDPDRQGRQSFVRYWVSFGRIRAQHFSARHADFARAGDVVMHESECPA